MTKCKFMKSLVYFLLIKKMEQCDEILTDSLFVKRVLYRFLVFNDDAFSSQ